MKMQWALIAGLVFALLTGIFAVINVDSVQVNLLFNTVKIPLILLILGCTLIGGIIVGSYGIFRQYRLQRENKQLKLRVSELRAPQQAALPPLWTRLKRWILSERTIRTTLLRSPMPFRVNEKEILRVRCNTSEAACWLSRMELYILPDRLYSV